MNEMLFVVTFDESEKDELASLLNKHINDLKSVSCLPKKHGYDQAPYEEITPSEYTRMILDIDDNHPLTRGGDLDTVECEGGACPIR